MPRFKFTRDGRVTIEKATDRPEPAEPLPTGRNPTHQERTRAQVYATGNKWQIEKYEATHN